MMLDIKTNNREREQNLLSAATIGELIKKARDGRFVQNTLAEAIGVSSTTIANIETDKLLPGQQTIRNLIEKLELPESVGKHMELLKEQAERKRDNERILKHAASQGLRVALPDAKDSDLQPLFDRIAGIIARRPAKLKTAENFLQIVIAFLEAPEEAPRAT